MASLETPPVPKGPKGEKRPADAIQRAVHIGRLAVGDIEPESDGKDPNAKALGAKGGAARAKSLTAKKRSEIAKKAAAKRWEK